MSSYLINAFATLFVAIDPIALAPMFVVLTDGCEQRERIKIAIQAIVTSAIILLSFQIGGAKLLTTLGISLPAFQTAGGLLLLIIAIEMVFEIRSKRKAQTVEKAATKKTKGDIAVFPLAIPLISGPAAISAVVLLSSNAPSGFEYAALMGIILGILCFAFLIFLLAGIIDRLLRASIQMVLTRLLGIIMAALAVQFIADGIGALVTSSSAIQ